MDLNNMFQLCGFADEAGNSLKEQIQALEENSMTFLELRNVDGKNVADLTAAEAKKLREQMDAHSLRVWSIGSPTGKIGIRDDFKSHLEQFRHMLEIADITGASHYRLFSFYNADDPAARDEVMERLSRLCEAAEGSPVLLCHENEKGIYGDNAERCLDIHRSIPRLKAIFDPANFIQCGEDTLEAFKMLAPYVEYIHIKDALPDGRVVPAGKGIGHIPEILSVYSGAVLTLEPHLTVFDGLQSLEGDKKSIVVEGVYPSQRAAFDAAVNALKHILAGL